MSTLERAIEIAARAHAGQVDKASAFQPGQVSTASAVHASSVQKPSISATMIHVIA